MSFQDAIRTCLTQKYATFSGRGRRSEFWFFYLFTIIVAIVASIIDGILGTKTSSGSGIIGGITSLALIVPQLAAGSRRLHDTGRSGWLQLLALIPIIGWIILIVWYASDSKPDNQYGPNPKGSVGGGQYYQQVPPPAAPGQY
ncbi:MAG TPA: DUF805 domain-containing protein [Kineosporiaceae bacterium]|jgi:uncharacterized membrane protein YhaH (DUF805 family)|nr:DUF805 domain-containing protein [Kineosporiaceae bacterium]